MFGNAFFNKPEPEDERQLRLLQLDKTELVEMIFKLEREHKNGLPRQGLF